jgi:hypothetical protein
MPSGLAVLGLTFGQFGQPEASICAADAEARRLEHGARYARLGRSALAPVDAAEPVAATIADEPEANEPLCTRVFVAGFIDLRAADGDASRGTFVVHNRAGFAAVARAFREERAWFDGHADRREALRDEFLEIAERACPAGIRLGGEFARA